jgi:rubrerythrin
MTHQRIDDVQWGEISIEEILELAIADEEYARDYYKHAAHLAGNLATRRMLLQLSEMEQGHADQLRKELGDLQQQRELEAGMAD